MSRLSETRDISWVISHSSTRDYKRLVKLALYFLSSWKVILKYTFLALCWQSPAKTMYFNKTTMGACSIAANLGEQWGPLWHHPGTNFPCFPSLWANTKVQFVFSLAGWRWRVTLGEICSSEFSTMCHSAVFCAFQAELFVTSFTSRLHSHSQRWFYWTQWCMSCSFLCEPPAAIRKDVRRSHGALSYGRSGRPRCLLCPAGRHQSRLRQPLWFMTSLEVVVLSSTLVTPASESVGPTCWWTDVLRMFCSFPCCLHWLTVRESARPLYQY